MCAGNLGKHQHHQKTDTKPDRLIDDSAAVFTGRAVKHKQSGQTDEYQRYQQRKINMQSPCQRALLRAQIKSGSGNSSDQFSHYSAGLGARAW